MNANNLIRSSLFVAGLTVASMCFAIQNLDAHGQSKVNNALAKKWTQSDPAQSGYQAQQNKSVVNVGSKKAGNCVVNVGTVKKEKGQKTPKDIVVTTKEVINICK